MTKTDIYEYLDNNVALDDLYMYNIIIHGCVDLDIGDDLSVEEMLTKMVIILAALNKDMMDQLIGVQLRGVIDFAAYE